MDWAIDKERLEGNPDNSGLQLDKTVEIEAFRARQAF
jgi:hypothetical protein